MGRLIKSAIRKILKEDNTICNVQRMKELSERKLSLLFRKKRAGFKILSVLLLITTPAITIETLARIFLALSPPLKCHIFDVFALNMTFLRRFGDVERILISFVGGPGRLIN